MLYHKSWRHKCEYSRILIAPWLPFSKSLLILLHVFSWPHDDFHWSQAKRFKKDTLPNFIDYPMQPLVIRCSSPAKRDFIFKLYWSLTSADQVDNNPQHRPKRDLLECKTMFNKRGLTKRQQHARQPVCNTILVTENTWTGNKVFFTLWFSLPMEMSLWKFPLLSNLNGSVMIAVGEGLGPGMYQH